jgi:hypothetical protein
MCQVSLRKPKILEVNIMGKRKIRKNFEDKFGNVVQVGDYVYAHGVNEGLEGTVVKCNDDNSVKAFNVMTTDGIIQYFNREWTRKGDPPQDEGA